MAVIYTFLQRLILHKDMTAMEAVLTFLSRLFTKEAVSKLLTTSMPKASSLANPVSTFLSHLATRDSRVVIRSIV